MACLRAFSHKLGFRYEDHPLPENIPGKTSAMKQRKALHAMRKVSTSSFLPGITSCLRFSRVAERISHPQCSKAGFLEMSVLSHDRPPK
jgi:hypothetical protein